jgi:hypothetical protein
VAGGPLQLQLGHGAPLHTSALRRMLAEIREAAEADVAAKML